MVKVKTPQGWSKLILCCLICFMASPQSTLYACAETEVKWTGNEADSAEGNSGPLPLSQNQREQLLQLEQVIRQSPDPEGTLVQAAQANNMSPQDLLAMLERNHADMQQGGMAPGGGGGGGMSSTVVGKISKLTAVLVAVLTNAAKQNPRSFSLIATSLLVMLMIAYSAPRTGVVLSNGRGIVSKAPTTLFKPPTRFLEKRMGQARFQEKDPKNKVLSERIWKDLELDEDETQWHSFPRKSELSKAATSRITIPMTTFLNADDEEEDEEYLESILEMCYNHAVDVMSARQFTEYPPDTSVLMHTLQAKDEGRKRFSTLAVKKLGNWGRFGLVPMLITQKQEGTAGTSLTFSTLKSSPFTGQLHVSAQQRKDRRNGPSLVLSVHLVTPKKGTGKLAKKMGTNLSNVLATSIATSIRTRTRQSLARRSQSSRFQGKAKKRALERRSSRFQKEKDIEEMAEDRRRRWQRKNPNSGNYRPSGDRMKSPNNAMY